MLPSAEHDLTLFVSGCGGAQIAAEVDCVVSTVVRLVLIAACSALVCPIQTVGSFATDRYLRWPAYKADGEKVANAVT